jgi:cold-inducible RNA-binding protein
MATKLFVGGISWDTTDDSLKNFFAQFGTVTSATVIKDKFTGKSKGFGFVEMTTEEEAKAAIEKGNGQTLDGRSIAVNEAKPMVPRDNNGGSFGGGRRDDRRGGRDSNRGGSRRSY